MTLAGSQFAYLTSDQFATTSVLASNKSGTVLRADSLMPAFNVAFLHQPSELVL